MLRQPRVSLEVEPFPAIRRLSRPRRLHVGLWQRASRVGRPGAGSQEADEAGAIAEETPEADGQRKPSAPSRHGMAWLWKNSWLGLVRLRFWTNTSAKWSDFRCFRSRSCDWAAGCCEWLRPKGKSVSETFILWSFCIKPRGGVSKGETPLVGVTPWHPIEVALFWKLISSGWWYTYPSEKWWSSVRQLFLWFPIYGNQTANQSYIHDYISMHFSHLKLLAQRLQRRLGASEDLSRWVGGAWAMRAGSDTSGNPPLISAEYGHYTPSSQGHVTTCKKISSWNFNSLDMFAIWWTQIDLDLHNRAINKKTSR